MNDGLFHHPVPKILAQKPRGIQVHPVTQNLSKFLFHRKKSEPRLLTRFEFHQHIYVAVGLKVWPQHGTENCQSDDAMFPAKTGNPLFGKGYLILKKARIFFHVSTRWLKASFRVWRSAYLMSPPMGRP